jgi:hypothetical protein
MTGFDTRQLEIHTLLRTDARCRVLAEGLRQLTAAELKRLHQALTHEPDTVVVDSVNFDPVARAWCPLAVGLGVPDVPAARQISTNDAGKQLILEVGHAKHGAFSLNPVSGIEGEFFRDTRHSDLTALVEYLLDHEHKTPPRAHRVLAMT